MRAITAIVISAIGAAIATGSDAGAATRAEGARTASPMTEFSAQERRRPRVRIYRETYDRGVVPSYFPGPNAVRDCSVSYVREFRPSGTVIAPHMRCFWRRP